MELAYERRKVGSERRPILDSFWAGFGTVDPAVDRPDEGEGVSGRTGVDWFGGGFCKQGSQARKPILFLSYGPGLAGSSWKSHDQVIAEPVHGVVRARAGGRQRQVSPLGALCLQQ